jgi:NADPH2:quinone reductase
MTQMKMAGSMRAAVVTGLGETPEVINFTKPAANTANEVVQVLAAALNPVDLVIASGSFGFRRATPPFVAGYSGVGERSDRSRICFEGPSLPYGALAQYAPITADGVLGEIGSLDPATAATLGVAGVAAWLALTRRAAVRPGETVLVLGAGGSAGRIAVQAAHALGAGVVVAVARSDASLHRARIEGAEHAVPTGDGLTKRLRQAAPQGYDVIIDFLWDEAATAAINAAAQGARLVQVGNQAGTTALIDAGSWRNRGMHLIGHSNFLSTIVERREAYAQLVQHTASSAIRIDCESLPLERVGDAWARLAAGSATRLVLIPDQ